MSAVDELKIFIWTILGIVCSILTFMLPCYLSDIFNDESVTASWLIIFTMFVFAGLTVLCLVNTYYIEHYDCTFVTSYCRRLLKELTPNSSMNANRSINSVCNDYEKFLKK